MAAKNSGKRFLGKVPVHSADTLWVTNFVKNALPHTISEILKIFSKEKSSPLVNKSAI